MIVSNDPITYLLERKFPYYRDVMRPPPLNEHDAPENEARRQDMRARMESYRCELNALPESELRERVAQEEAKHCREIKQRDALEEKGRFFNKLTAHADFAHWAKMRYWKLDEGIALCFGKSPDVVTWEKVKPFVLVSAFAKRFSNARDIAMRAVAVNELAQSNYPGPFLAWAKRYELPVPKELEAKVAARGPVADWRTLYEQAQVRVNELEAKLRVQANAHKWPWGTHETQLLRRLNEAASRFWINYDPDQPDTAPTNKQVADWLKGKDVSARASQVIAQILRADDLPPGRR